MVLGGHFNPELCTPQEATIGCFRSRLIPTDLTAGSNLGINVDADSNSVIIGAGSNSSTKFSGAAYVYRKMGTDWVSEDKLLGIQLPPNNLFGTDVAISGNTAAVSDIAASDYGPESGAVYIFTRIGSQWIQQARIVANDGAAGDWFGFKVALQGDRLGLRRRKTTISGLRLDRSTSLSLWGRKS
jgi:hypothetical protein